MSLFAFLLAVWPAELLLAGDWAAEQAVASCAVRQTLSEPTGQSQVGLRIVPNTDTLELFISQPSSGGRDATGSAKVILGGGAIPEWAMYSSTHTNGTQVISIKLPIETLDKLPEAETISIRAGRSANVLIRSTRFANAVRVLAECESALLASWGFDKTRQDSVSVPLKGSLSGLIRANDYPPSLLRANVQGDVGFRIRIDANGRIGECIVLESSGNALLDQHTCALIQERAHFSPAIGRDGKPMASFTYGLIRWRAK